MAKREMVSAINNESVARQYVECLDEVIAQYKNAVFDIALHLTGCDDAAKEVAEDVFVRLYWALPNCESSDLESLVHEFTYECAIARLIGNVNSHVQKTRELLVSDGQPAVDGAAYEELEDRESDALVLVRSRLTQAIEMMGEAAKSLRGYVKA